MRHSFPQQRQQCCPHRSLEPAAWSHSSIAACRLPLRVCECSSSGNVSMCVARAKEVLVVVRAVLVAMRLWIVGAVRVCGLLCHRALLRWHAVRWPSVLLCSVVCLRAMLSHWHTVWRLSVLLCDVLLVLRGIRLVASAGNCQNLAAVAAAAPTAADCRSN